MNGRESICSLSSKLLVGGSSPPGVATQSLSGTDRWVTECTQDMGDNLVPNQLSRDYKAPCHQSLREPMIQFAGQGRRHSSPAGSRSGPIMLSNRMVIRSSRR